MDCGAGQQGMQLEKEGAETGEKPLGQGRCVRAWEGTRDKAWKLPSCSGQGPSFKRVTTVHKQTTNLISSLFTALRPSPGRLINIRELPKKEPFSEGGCFYHRMRGGKWTTCQTDGGVDRWERLGHRQPAPLLPQTHTFVPQNTTNTPTKAVYACVCEHMWYALHLVWQAFSSFAITSNAATCS